MWTACHLCMESSTLWHLWLSVTLASVWHVTVSNAWIIAVFVRNAQNLYMTVSKACGLEQPIVQNCMLSLSVRNAGPMQYWSVRNACHYAAFVSCKCFALCILTVRDAWLYAVWNAWLYVRNAWLMESFEKITINFCLFKFTQGTLGSLCVSFTIYCKVTI